MKGLLLKDLYVLTRQMRFFLLFIIFFSVMPGSNMTMFAVIYAAMLPYTALAYDERCKWDQLALTMPYSPRQMVLSKYLLGWGLTGAVALVTLAAGAVETLFGLDGARPVFVLISLCAGFLIMALTLPAMFRFGVERGRMFFIILMVFAATGSAGLVSAAAENPYAVSLLPRLSVAAPIVAAVASAVSVALSIRFYARRDR